MFTGLLFSQLLGHDKTGASRLNAEVMAFIRDFGLIIFVYAVGVQVGPGFLASLRKRGLPLNLMAAAIVLLGAVIAVGLASIMHVNMQAAVGLFAGGTTNAPAFGSAGEALKSIHHDTFTREVADQTGPAFAISYPFGLVGVIIAMVAVRFVFRVDVAKAADSVASADGENKPKLDAMNIELTNPNLDGLTLDKIADLQGEGVVISRILHNQKLMVAHPDTKVQRGDILLAVGPTQELADLRVIVGIETTTDLRSLPSEIITRHALVTNREVLGQTMDKLDLTRRLGVAITRIERAGLEFTAVGNLTLQFGDRCRLVGEPDSLTEAAKELGNSARELNLPRLLPIFVGIALGVILGSFPVTIGGLPAPVKLGLASGPMIIAIILARIGRVGPLIWYMPHSASALLRELGIVLFLIAVGLLAGDGFFKNLFSTVGMQWLAYGAIITLLPLLIVGIAARKIFNVNYLHICGLLAGSMTSPSLAFTQTMTASEAPAVAFATVYPLTMILRVLLAQLIVLIFVR
jgi:putative transport protein